MPRSPLMRLQEPQGSCRLPVWSVGPNPMILLSPSALFQAQNAQFHVVPENPGIVPLRSGLNLTTVAS